MLVFQSLSLKIPSWIKTRLSFVTGWKYLNLVSHTVSLLSFCFNVGLNTLKSKFPVNMLEETMINQTLLESGYYIMWYLVSLICLLFSWVCNLLKYTSVLCSLRETTWSQTLEFCSPSCTPTKRGERRQKKKALNGKASG